jgi:hypothetical protein
MLLASEARQQALHSIAACCHAFIVLRIHPLLKRPRADKNPRQTRPATRRPTAKSPFLPLSAQKRSHSRCKMQAKLSMRTEVRVQPGNGSSRASPVICRAVPEGSKQLYTGKNVSPPTEGIRSVPARPWDRREGSQQGAARRPAHCTHKSASSTCHCFAPRAHRPAPTFSPPSASHPPQASTSSTSTTSPRTSSSTCWSAGSTPRRSSTRATSRSSPLPAARWR